MFHFSGGSRSASPMNREPHDAERARPLSPATLPPLPRSAGTRSPSPRATCRKAETDVEHRCSVKCHRSQRPTAQATLAAKQTLRREQILDGLMDTDRGGEGEDPTTTADSPPPREQSNVDNNNSATDSSGWTYVNTRAERAISAAQQKVAKAMGQSTPGGADNSAFEIFFECPDAPDSLKGLSVLKIYEEIRKTIPGAHARITNHGKLAIRVAQPNQIDHARALQVVCGLPIRLVADNLELWGRITGVNPQFSEKDLLECLRDKGVVEVRREMYATTGLGKNKENVKVMKPSSRVRIRFDKTPLAEVTIVDEKFNVILCPGSPLQCLSCHQFGHKSSECTKRGNPTCRKCGKPGHQMWACQSKARCANCGEPHAATDGRCGVKRVYAEAEKQKLYSRVATRFENIAEDFPSFSTPVHTSTSCVETQMEPGRSYADITKKSSPKQVCDKEGKVLCHLPPPTPLKKPPATTLSRPKTQQSSTLPQKHEICPAPPQASYIVDGIIKIWKLVKGLLSSWLKENPLIAKVLEFLESEGGKVFLISVFEGSNEGDTSILTGLYKDISEATAAK